MTSSEDTAVTLQHLFGDHIEHTLLTTEQIDSFQQRGFVAIEGLLSDAELRTYRAAVDEAVARRTAGDTRPMSEKTTYEQSFVQCMRLWEDSPAVRPLTFHRNIGQAAAELLSVRAVRLWQDQALYKEPGGRITDAHQDQTFWPIGEQPLISAWVALVDVTASNGAMAYVPGSHKAGRLRVVDITNATEPYDIVHDPALHGAVPELVEARAGTVIFHHGLTVHRAGANTTDAVRKAMTMVYSAEGLVRLKSWPVFSLDRDQVAVGAAVAGPGIPRVWPRAEGDLPAPPAIHGADVGFGFGELDDRQ